ncbi:hypothetical protein [Melghirimyces profundicolus]|uniref:hypothetical protein n=1 Tax=Melghirimyces profundicolus TaxID=1242148 RepID=UPI000D39F395|nr:hypothetical protein [Melghirimyces profundicolus]
MTMVEFDGHVIIIGGGSSGTRFTAPSDTGKAPDTEAYSSYEKEQAQLNAMHPVERAFRSYTVVEDLGYFMDDLSWSTTWYSNKVSEIRQKYDLMLPTGLNGPH